MADSGINVIWAFFKPSYLATNHSLRQFKEEWDALTDKDKNDIREGIGNGSLTY